MGEIQAEGFESWVVSRLAVETAVRLVEEGAVHSFQPGEEETEEMAYRVQVVLSSNLD